MSDSDALPQLLQYRERRWKEHCGDVLEQLLLPIARKWDPEPQQGSNRGAVLIDNRIDQQWLFSVLNTTLMCPPGTQLCLITDAEAQPKAKNRLKGFNWPVEPWWGVAEELVPGTMLSEPSSFNQMLKKPAFWDGLPLEQLLLFQTDSLLAQPLPAFYFSYPYLGAPFLPKQSSEIFERRSSNGLLVGFFKVDTAIHGQPNRDVYPHLHGNGGLSIRQRSLMRRICEEYGAHSPTQEMEDVFFSRHLKKIGTVPPLEVAQTFACESRYLATAIGSHAGWKYWNGKELADHLERHWKQVWALGEAMESNDCTKGCQRGSPRNSSE